MTEEERQKLCAEMRELGELYAEKAVRGSFPGVGELLGVAADEIERLAKEVARLKDEYGILLERTTNMLDMTVR